MSVSLEKHLFNSNLETYHGSVESSIRLIMNAAPTMGTIKPKYHVFGASGYWAVVNTTRRCNERTAYLEHLPVMGIDVGIKGDLLFDLFPYSPVHFRDRLLDRILVHPSPRYTNVVAIPK